MPTRAHFAWTARSKERAFSLVELLVVMALIALFAGVVGIPVIQNAFSPSGSQKVAWIIATLSEHAQSYAVESGQLTVQEIDLSETKMRFYVLSKDGSRESIADQKFKERNFSDKIRFVQAESAGQVIQEGKLIIPFFPAGYSRESLLVLRETETDEHWSVLVRKFFGEVKVFEGIKNLRDVKEEINPDQR